MMIERFLAVKYVSICVNVSRKEGLEGCMVRYAAGNVLRKYGLGVIDLRKPVCFKVPWFYVRMERCIRRNHLEGVGVEEWCDSKSVMKIIEAKEEMEVIGGLTKDLAWMAVHGCLPTREFQKKRSLINSEICEREGCGRNENIPHVFWECLYAKEVWWKMGKMIKGLTGVQLLTFHMMLYGLCDIDKKQSQILWLIVNCIKEVLWDVRNILVFNKTGITVAECVNMIRGKLFLYVLSDQNRLGTVDSEGIWKYKKWKFWI
ncbi:hypothetical protein XELAEV_18036406mg [Xenopus laevis]|uniref:Reverse transcriptase zinc-binding domain-containing protein n=1 Tax=Xenopus laevis TaxID=8355 RepID=A0A974HCZ4_XENLA|nr:hypothetical protein XELAEV_18036406mg [Xenopus laevis]